MLGEIFDRHIETRIFGRCSDAALDDFKGHLRCIENFPKALDVKITADEDCVHVLQPTSLLSQ